MIYKIETDNWIYEVVNKMEKDFTYTVYVYKTSKLTNTYVGEAVYAQQLKEPEMDLKRENVILLTYVIY